MLETVILAIADMAPTAYIVTVAAVIAAGLTLRSRPNSGLARYIVEYVANMDVEDFGVGRPSGKGGKRSPKRPRSKAAGV